MENLEQEIKEINLGYNIKHSVVKGILFHPIYSLSLSMLENQTFLEELTMGRNICYSFFITAGFITYDLIKHYKFKQN
ncbi:hypothetical protein ACFL1H_07600 [Nanoarchaeota archaeon]